MPDEPIGNDSFVTELDIRLWMRDAEPEANLLIDDFEYTPEQIRSAMTFVVDYFNDQPPFMIHSMHTVESFPFRSALIGGTAAQLLFIAAMGYRRNNLDYAVPGGAVNDQNKFKEYDAAGNRLWQEYKQWVTHVKRAINMESGFAMVKGPRVRCRY